jgi:hypothetical protein
VGIRLHGILQCGDCRIATDNYIAIESRIVTEFSVDVVNVTVLGCIRVTPGFRRQFGGQPMHQL